MSEWLMLVVDLYDFNIVISRRKSIFPIKLSFYKFEVKNMIG